MTELVAAVPAAPELGFTHFIAQTDVVGQGLFVILVIMSLVSWALIVTKGVGLFRRQRRSQAFLSFFWNATSLEAVQNEIATHGVSEPFAHLTAHACTPRRTMPVSARPSWKRQAVRSDFLTRTIKKVLDEETMRWKAA
jgi:biopolymer transport protein ExbB